jgi:hypothetical protein
MRRLSFAFYKLTSVESIQRLDNIERGQFMFLYNYWYVTARSNDVARTPWPTCTRGVLVLVMDKIL